YEEIRLPVFERTELFARGIGEVTDIVQKEMYTFLDRAGEAVTLRPEATASLLRAYIEHGLHVHPKPVRLYTMGPMFRRHRRQDPAGRRVLGPAPGVEEAPGDDWRRHFADVREYLDAMAIPYVLNHRLVRGLDYYVRTTFELTTVELGAQNAVAGGGRYDGLI